MLPIRVLKAIFAWLAAYGAATPGATISPMMWVRGGRRPLAGMAAAEGIEPRLAID